MRQNIKKEIAELLQSAEKQHVRAMEMGKAKQYGEMKKILAECQQAAIYTGLALEEEGGAKDIVEKLEGYCESLYQFGERAAKRENLKAVCEEINVEIGEINAQIDEKVEIHFEIVFLPYKASMWDSLESIWLEAKKYDCCRCHVIALPYYERLPNGECVEEKTDAPYFPDYVPITDYREYNIEQMLPDAIFIHNPYDGTNQVTSIHPKYYSSLLRKYTKCLVYVPYFVVSDELREEFCLLPGVLYSNFIITQSEKINRMYCDAIENAFELKKDTARRQEWMQKFVVLGSPKTDKVVNAKRQDFNFPEEWKEALHETTDSKRFVLFNTSINSFLSNGNEVIKKIESILEFFERHDRLTLWWRPHPLITATLKAQCPGLVQLYEELVCRFKGKKIGIFDDTSDLNRAICCSDAYLGDWSSLIWLYQLTGKPILVNHYLCAAGSDVYADVEDFIWYKGEIWFVSYNFNGIFCMNPEDGNIRFVDELPFERSMQSRLSYAVTLFESNLVITPYKGKNIVCYDMEKRTFRHQNVKGTFVSFIKDGANIFMLPIRGNKGLKYNIQKNDVSHYFSIPLDHMEAGFRRETCWEDGKKGYFVTGTNNILYCYDYVTDEISRKEIGSEKCKFYAVKQMNNQLILVGYSEIVLVDKSSDQQECVISYPSGFCPGSIPFCDVKTWNNSLFLIPSSANMIVQLQIKNKQTFCFLYCHNIFHSFNTPLENVYTCAEIVGDKMYVFSKFEHSLHIIDIHDKSINKVSLVLSDEIKEKIYNRKLIEYKSEGNGQSESFFELENEMVSINRYLNSVENENYGLNRDRITTDFFINYEGNCGEEIFRFIMNQLKK